MKYCLLIVSALVIMASCTKVDPITSKQEILRGDLKGDTLKWTLDTGFVNKKWKMDGADVPADFDIVESYPEPSCREDDVLIFRELNEGVHLPGAVTCSINETPAIEFRWGLTDNDTKMFIYDAKEFFGMDINAEILELYEDKFTIRYSEYKDKHISFPDMPSYWVRDTTIYTITFKKFVPKKQP